MKKIFFIVFFITLIMLVGCNNTNENTEKTNDYVDSILQTSENEERNQINNVLKMVNEDKPKEDKESKDIELTRLCNKILEMSRDEFFKSFENYNIFLYRAYAFFEYENDICVAVMFGEDYKSINDCYVYDKLKKIDLDDAIITKINVGMSPMDVVKLIGNPKLSATFGLSSLDFYLKNNIVRVFLASPNYIYDVKILPIKDPSYTVDDKCESKEEKTEVDKAILILKNMTFEEVVAVIGNPQRTFGSGAIWYEWDLEENKLLQVMFGRKSMDDDTLYVIKCYIK